MGRAFALEEASRGLPKDRQVFAFALAFLSLVQNAPPAGALGSKLSACRSGGKPNRYPRSGSLQCESDQAATLRIAV
jgi:hypothetical protein